MTLASLKQQNYSVREIASVLGCSASTVSRKLRRNASAEDRRGQIPDMLSAHMRTPEVEDLQFPNHWESDLIKGEGNASAVGTLVQRTGAPVPAQGH